MVDLRPNNSSEATRKIANFEILLAVELIGDNLQAYRNDRELALQSQTEDVDPDVAHATVFRQLSKSEKLKEA